MTKQDFISAFGSKETVEFLKANGVDPYHLFQTSFPGQGAPPILQRPSYQDFLEAKIIEPTSHGIQIDEKELNPALFPHQRDIVIWMLRGGRRGLFSSFGTGKSVIQLEIAHQVLKAKGGRFLIVCPFAVMVEFSKDAENILGYEAPVYVKTREEVLKHETGVLITNYERVRDGDVDPNDFVGVSLDEASVLRGYGTKTYQTFLPKFKDVKYRFVATATPAPNKLKELIHYAGFLGVMDTGEALTRFFQRNSQKANDLTLYPHKEQEFWYWVSSWAVFLFKPSDLGYSDEGYDLPEIKIHLHRLPVDHASAGADSWGNVKMFRESARSLSDAAKEKRDSLNARIQKAREIVDAGDYGDHWLLWHHLEAERKEIEKVFTDEKRSGGLRSVWGSMGNSAKCEERELAIRDFGDGKYRILSTKPQIAGSGCNFQKHCHKAIFVGINHKFNDFIQAIHRIHRFLQNETVEIHIIYMESEDAVFDNLMGKWEQHKELIENMRDIVQRFGLSNIKKFSELKRTIGVDRKEKKGQFYTIAHNDCTLELPRLEENSVKMICTSIPFGDQYEYCPSYNDFGHNSGNDAFFEQMDYVIPEMLRVLEPGRIAAIHVKDRIRFGNVTGYGVPTVERFSDKTADCFQKHGFLFLARIVITTDVVRENNQTYRLGWTENSKDSTKMGSGMSEYVMVFRKPQTDTSKAYADLPVTKDKKKYTRARWQIDAHGHWASSGDRLLTPEEWASRDMDHVTDIWKAHCERNGYDYEYHVSAGEVLEQNGRLPASFMLFPPPSTDPNVWTDILRMNTLNSEQSRKRQENHVCPLQLDIIERLINRYTNEGDLVLDPFGGLMSVPYVAVKMNRKGYGIELNEEYFEYGCGYMYAIEYKKTVPTLFDFDTI